VVKKVAVTVAGRAPVVKVWEVKTGKEMLAAKIEPPNGMYRLTFSPDSKRLFFGSSQGARAWDLPDGQETFKFQSHPGGVLAFSSSPDRTRIATGRGQSGGCAQGCSEPAQVNIWDAATGKLLLSIREPIEYGLSNQVWQLVWSPDGKRLAGMGLNNPHIIVWSAIDGRLIYPFEEHRAPVTSVAFSPDGKFLASFSDCKQQGMVLDGHTGKHLTTLSRAGGFGAHGYGGYGFGHGGGGCVGLAFTSDSQFLARASAGAACYGPPGGNMLWNRDSGKQVVLSKKIGSVLAYGPDGKRFVGMPALPESKDEKPKPIPLDKLPFARMYQGEDTELFEL
jgi:WD40 repeat protein